MEIINNKKLNWSYVRKVMVKIADEHISYEAPLTVSDLAKIHFITGKLLEDYYSEDNK